MNVKLAPRPAATPVSTALLVLAMLAALLTGGLLPAGAAAASTPASPAPAAGSPPGHGLAALGAGGSQRARQAPARRRGRQPAVRAVGLDDRDLRAITPYASPVSACTIAFRRGGRRSAAKVLAGGRAPDGGGELPSALHEPTARAAPGAAGGPRDGAGAVASGKAPAVQFVHTELAPGSQRGLGAAAAVRAQPAALRGPAERGLRRRHRTGR